MDKQKNHSSKGIPIKIINYIIAGIIFIVSVLLLFATFRTSQSYNDMKETTENYIQWQDNANDLQIASDYLTEQVRYFVETGSREYLDNYFTEATVTRRRDNAVEKISEFFKDDDEAFKKLQTAMNNSLDLMIREYYAMRLKIESLGLDVNDFPKQIQNVKLTPDDEALDSEQQADAARKYVFDEYYHNKKAVISKNVNLCLSSLIEEIELRQESATEKLQLMIDTVRVLIIILIILVVFIVTLTTVQVIRPLVKAVPRIREDRPLKVEGASEFRFLAETYNQMFETNTRIKKKLEFDASHDPLTGAYNRAGFDNIIKTPRSVPIALLIIDIDRFKQINDNYGHDTGDKVLKKVAGLIYDCFRADDCLCRIGGDEFVLFMQNTESDKKELIRSKIKALNDKLQAPDDGLPPLSLSVGVVFTDGRHMTNAYKNADKALYVTKNNGRCGVSFYGNK